MGVHGSRGSPRCAVIAMPKPPNHHQNAARASDSGSVSLNFRRLALANVGAQVIPLLVSPILTRIYDPAAFGAFGVFSTITANVSAVATLKLDWLMPNEASPGRARALLRAGLATTAAAAFATPLAVSLLPALGNQLHDPTSRMLLPVAVLCTGVIALLSGWWIREGALGVMGVAKVAQATVTATVAIALGTLAGQFGWGLEGAFVAGLITACVLMRVPLTAKQPEGATDIAQSATSVAWELRRGAATSTAIAAANTLCNSIPIIVTTVVYSAEQVGWVVLAQRVILAPPALLSAAFANAFWSNAAALARGSKIEELSRLYRRTTLRLLGISLLPAGGCMLAPYLIGPIFGAAEWQAAGEIGQAFAPMVIGSIALAPTNHLVVLGEQRLQFLSDGARLALSVLVAVLASWLGLGLTLTIWLLSSASLFGNAVLFVTHITAHARARSRI